MKNLFSLILVLTLGVGIIVSLNQNDAFSTYGDAAVENRVSNAFIQKSVTEENTVVEFGEENYETGSANIVTSIVANYRSFDTLGEVTVLFISSFGVALLLGTKKTKRINVSARPNFMLKVGSRALFAIMVMIGLFISIHGHLTPGGGFPGGTIVAASVLLLYLSDESFRTRVKGFKILESIAGTLYILIGLVGLYLSGYFLENFLDTGVVGELLSAGIVPIVYVLIGLKVGSEVSGMIDHFLTEEVTA